MKEATKSLIQMLNNLNSHYVLCLISTPIMYYFSEEMGSHLTAPRDYSKTIPVQPKVSDDRNHSVTGRLPTEEKVGRLTCCILGDYIFLLSSADIFFQNYF